MLKIGQAEQHAGSAREAVPVPGSRPTNTGSTGVPVSGAADARRFLELYIRSFDSTPKGSEYFRLAVDESVGSDTFYETAELPSRGRFLLQVDEVGPDPTLREEAQRLTRVGAALGPEDLDLHGSARRLAVVPEL